MTQKTDEATEETPDSEAFSVTINGREIQLHPMRPLQLSMLIRALKRVEADSAASGEDVQRALDRATGVILSGIILDEDREWIIDQVMERNISDAELLRMFVPEGTAKPEAPAHGPTRAKRSKSK